MRVSNSFIHANIVNQLHNNLESMFDIQNKINTGRIYQFASDNPVSAITSMKIRNNLAVNSHYSERQSHIKPYMEIASSKISSITDHIRKIKTDLNYAANSTVTSEELKTIANNIDQAITGIITAANTEYNNVYLFGGYNTDNPPFVREGDSAVRYTGTGHAIQQEISKGVYTNVTVPGNSLFQTHTVTAEEGVYSLSAKLNQVLPAVPAGDQFSIAVGNKAPVTFTVDYANESLQDLIDRINDSSLDVSAYAVQENGLYHLKIDSQLVGEAGVLTILDDLGAAGNGLLESLKMADSTGITGTETEYSKGLLDTLLSIKADLEGGNITRIPDAVEKINASYENILGVQFNISHDIKRLETAQSNAKDEEFRLKELLSNTEDIDLTEAITDLGLRQNAYQAALMTSSRIMEMSLLNYI